MNTDRPALICFGEILWDFLPSGLFPGGAPFNVAYHLHLQGADVRVVSAVGSDLLGDELRRRLQGWGLTTTDVGRHPDLPTGHVRATITTGGDASYEIVTGVAWDRIFPTEELLRWAHQASGIIYGSLAQRSSHNQAILQQLLAVLPADAWRIFDVNLRPPFDDLSLVHRLAAGATLFKMNTTEAARLAADHPESPGREEANARSLASQTGCPMVCITAGARGAGLLHENRWYWENGRPVAVIDTVGAGDAFLAALVRSLMRGNTAAASLALACRIGEWVASQAGAIPDYDTKAFG